MGGSSSPFFLLDRFSKIAYLIDPID